MARCFRLLVLGSLLAALASCDRSPVAPGSPVPDPAAPPPTPIDARLAFVSTRDGARYIYRADESGVTRLAPGDRPAWSPDGSRIAFHGATGSEGIFVMNADGTGVRHLGQGSNPDWSPDGTRIVFNYEDGNGGGIFVMNADGSGATKVLDQDRVKTPNGYDCGVYWPAWSPDGRRIAFVCASYDDVWQINLVNADGSGLRRLVESSTSFFTQSDPTWSPDGTRIAFDSFLYHIDSINIDGSDSRTLVSDGFWADWSANGRLAFTRRTGPGPTAGGGFETRIFSTMDGGAESQLVPDAVNPPMPRYGDSNPAWAR